MHSGPANPPACVAAGCVSYLHICRRFVSGKLVNQIKGRHADKSDGKAHRGRFHPFPRRSLVPTLHVRMDHARHHQTGATESCSPRSQPGRWRDTEGCAQTAVASVGLSARSGTSIKTPLCHQA